MKYKKIAAVLTAATVFLSTVSMTYAETPFKDIENNWAKAHIISVHDKGLMNGTAEDVFSPDVVVTKYSAIKAIGTMMGTGIMDLTDIVSKHREVLEKYKVPEYAKPEVAYCIDKNIVQAEIELPRFEEKPNATKLDICVYLGRAFGVELDTSKPPVTLLFKDALEIPSMYKIYVDHMIKIGVVDGKGDAEGLFNPNMPVTRAMFAKMLDIASSEYVKTVVSTDTSDLPGQNIEDQTKETAVEETPTDITDDSQTTTTPADSSTAEEVIDRGIIDTITYTRNSQPKILVEKQNKDLVEYTVPEDLMKENIIINGQLSDVYSLRPGLYVELKALSGVVDWIKTIEMTTQINTLATIVEVDILNEIMYVEIVDQEGLTTEKKVFLSNTRVGDLLLNILTIDALSPGQRINLIGEENLEGIKATSIIINN